MIRYKIFNTPIDNVTMRETESIMKEMLRSKKTNLIFTPNPEILLRASYDMQYSNILGRADLALPDGIGLIWVGRMIGMPFQERVSGVDALLVLCKLASQMSKSIFLLGGKKGVAQKTVFQLKKRFPHLRIAGSCENIEILQDSNNIKEADILFVALGAKKQEKWIIQHQDKFPNIKIMMAIGGAFDMLSGNLLRAPLFMQIFGLEWLWRFLLEPKKRLKRIYNAVIIFPIKVLWEKYK